MQISKINYGLQNQYNRKNNTKNNQVNFEGFRFKKTDFVTTAMIQNAREEVVNFINYYFSPEALRRAGITDDVVRNNMLLAFAKKLKKDEAVTKTIAEEAPEIFGRVSAKINPDNLAQRLILNDNRFTVAEFEQLIPLLEKTENAELTETLLRIRNELNGRLDFSKSLHSILELNCSEKLNKNIGKFRSYIVLHSGESNFVEQLGKELKAENLSFDYKTLDKLVDIKKKQNVSPILMKLSDESLIKGNAKAIDFLYDGYSSQVINQMADLTPEDYKFFEYFVSTSNPKNVSTRISFLKRNINHVNERQPFGDMQALFERMEENNKIQKIVDAYLDSDEFTKLLPAKELMFYVDKFGVDAIIANMDSFLKVARLNKNKTPDEIAKVLESQLKNKYYMTSAELTRIESREKYNGKAAQFFGRIKRGIRALFERFSAPAEPVKPLNDIKYENYEIKPIKQKVMEIVQDAAQPVTAKQEEFIGETFIPELTEAEKADEKTIKAVMKELESAVDTEKFSSVVEETATSPAEGKVISALENAIPEESAKTLEFVEEVPTIHTASEVIDLTPKTNKPLLEFVEEVQETAEAAVQPAKKTIVREYKSDNPKISARKLKLFNDAQEIIKTRMKSAKQIEEQAHDYSITATKMRNKYLNELFDYVADIRKAETKQGKKSHSVSNYDVLELYQKIKKYNEKEFRRMLRAKNPNGERMYSFKEINKMLDDSMIEHYRLQREQQIAMQEAKKPKPTPAGIVNSGMTTYEWQKLLESIHGKGKVKMQPVKLLEPLEI